MTMRMRRTREGDNKSKEDIDSITIKKKTSKGDEDAGHRHGLCNIVDVEVLKCLKCLLNHHHHIRLHIPSPLLLSSLLFSSLLFSSLLFLFPLSILTVYVC